MKTQQSNRYDKNAKKSLRNLQKSSREDILFAELHARSIGLDDYSMQRIPKSYSNLTGYVPSDKNPDPTPFHSKLERDFYILLEFKNSVLDYQAQPMTIKPINSQEKLLFRQYTPDVLVNYLRKDKKSELCEVKYREDIKKEYSKYRPKFKAARRVCKEHGWLFRIITDREIYTEYFENANFLLPYKYMEVDQNIFMKMYEGVKRLEDPTPRSLMKYCYENKWDQASAVHVLWHAIGGRYIMADLEEKLTMDSPLWINKYG